jgi:hypothetical protein
MRGYSWLKLSNGDCICDLGVSVVSDFLVQLKEDKANTMVSNTSRNNFIDIISYAGNTEGLILK